MLMDVVVMAAAVADYTPAERAAQKVSKDADTLTLVLEEDAGHSWRPGRRRLASGKGPLLIGFAAETEQVVRARASEARAQTRRPHRGERRLAVGRRLRRRHECRDDRRPGGGGDAAAPDQVAGRRRGAGSRRTAAHEAAAGCRFQIKSKLRTEEAWKDMCPFEFARFEF